MSTPGHHTRREIFSQPQVWAATLERLQAQSEALRTFYAEGRYEALVFTGCGSTYYLALAAAALAKATLGVPTVGVPGSEAWLYPEGVYPAGRRTLLVAVSRSGETTETIRAGEAFLAAGRGDFVTLTCYPQSALAQMGALNLHFPEAQEQSVAQTRAFSALYLAAVAVIAVWAGRDDLLAQMQRLPQAAARLLERYAELPARLVRSDALDRFYFLGSGPRYGLACELSLKMKEMSLSHSEPFHFLEFRHGPMSMVTPSTLIVGLLSEANRAAEQAVLDEMRARGAQVLTMAEHDAEIAFQSNIAEAARNALYLPIGQLVAFERALYNSLDPDHPHNLNAVVTL